MTETNELYEEGNRSCKAYLQKHLQNPDVTTEKDLRDTLDKFFKFYTQFEPVKQEIEKEAKIYTAVVPGGEANILEDENRSKWFEEKKSSYDFNRKKAFISFIQSEQILPPSVINRLDTDTNKVLERLADPEAKKSDIRGLVYGNVQMGKTTNYSMLINKAYDVGYKFIVILAGATNALRTQTQIELEKNVTGNSTDENEPDRKIGIRSKFNSFAEELEPVISLTARKSDFNRTQSQTAIVNLEAYDKFFLVIKKNVAPLRELNFFLNNTDRGQELRNKPFLLIDDEADQASPDTREVTNPDEHNPTAINAQIRSLLDLFNVSSYVGYTATPFANIFIDPESNRFTVNQWINETDEDGSRRRVRGDITSEHQSASLFPNDFIIRINPPENYYGVHKIFRIGSEDDSMFLPQVKILEDLESDLGLTNERNTWCAPRHRNGSRHTIQGISQIPQTLKDAIKTFILIRIIMDKRLGNKSFNTMLVNTSIFTDSHRQIVMQIEEYISDLNQRLDFNDKEIIDKFKITYNEIVKTQDDFKKTLLETNDKYQNSDQEFYDEFSKLEAWSPKIENKIKDSLNRIFVKQMSAEFHFNLKDNQYLNKSVIVVGSAKLSRGIVLPNLSVSYFLRVSGQYDTLMQMGRWFGYRDKYMDISRLYISADLARRFSDIANAIHELELEFDEMISQEGTPRDYGLRIKQMPALMITANNKMRNSQVFSFTMDDKFAQTSSLTDIKNEKDKNESLIREFLLSLDQSLLSKSESEEGVVVWDNINHKDVLSFLRGFQKQSKIITRNWNGGIFDWIEKENKVNNLINWTVVLKGKKSGEEFNVSDKIKVYRAERKASWAIKENEDILYNKKSNIKFSTEDEMYGLSEEELDRAQKKSGKEIPPGKECREARSTSKGLLLIYPMIISGVTDSSIKKYQRTALALSIPKIPGSEPIEYRANVIFQEELFR